MEELWCETGCFTFWPADKILVVSGCVGQVQEKWPLVWFVYICVWKRTEMVRRNGQLFLLVLQKIKGLVWPTIKLKVCFIAFPRSGLKMFFLEFRSYFQKRRLVSTHHFTQNIVKCDRAFSILNEKLVTSVFTFADNAVLGQAPLVHPVTKKRRCKNQVYRGPRKSKSPSQHGLHRKIYRCAKTCLRVVIVVVVILVEEPPPPFPN